MKKEVVRLRENYKDAVLAQLAVAIGGHLNGHSPDPCSLI